MIPSTPRRCWPRSARISADYAARVWRHFDSPGNGCDFVAEIVAGRVDLSLPSR
ncbi:hypothetical protein [Rhodovulum steppense]|uniref:hypothetical protein n=1 Tax=Rhodovulum steppense TaxID=540251 RepID=UPI00140525ED|nr:hypothetical protein [Rhodovulum steppense]